MTYGGGGKVGVIKTSGLKEECNLIWTWKKVLQDVLTDKECCEALTEAQMDRF